MNRRSFFFLPIGIVIVLILALRLFDLMILQGSSFRAQADENRFFRKLTFPQRGVLVDRHGVVLVKNTVTYKKSASGKLNVAHPSDLVEISQEEALQLLMDHEEYVSVVSGRVPVFDTALSHVVGYVGFVDPNREEYVVSLDERVGKAGAEKSFQDALRGSAGEKVYEMSATGELLRLVQETPARSGSDVTLTIDSALSQAAFAALGGKKGAAVVSVPATGEVLALVSSPGYALASFSAALSDEDKPLLNRALSSYPPGSTFKMVTALAALSSQKVTADTTVMDEGQLKVGQSVFGNWYYRQYGRTEGVVTLTKALSRSNDIYFYKAAEFAGPEAIADIGKKLGFGSVTGIELSEDQPGILPTPAWKEQHIGEKWYLGDTYHMGIGQGYVLATPLQINTMVATIGNKGVRCTPRIGLSSESVCRDLLLDPTHIELIVAGMVGACSRGGTAFPFFEINEQLAADKKIACKTGTAEFGSSDAQGRKKTHAWFTMVYPVRKPTVAITVLVESNPDQPFMEGSSDAAPVAKTIWEAWKKTYEK